MNLDAAVFGLKCVRFYPGPECKISFYNSFNLFQNLIGIIFIYDYTVFKIVARYVTVKRIRE